MSDAQFWEQVGRVYVDSENVRENRQAWLKAFRSTRAQRHCLMTSEEAEEFRALPAESTVWCGCLNAEELDGVSVTTDRGVASWVAARYARLEGGTGFLVEASVRREDVMACVSRRGEHELLVLPEHVRERKIVDRISPARARRGPNAFAKDTGALRYAKKNAPLRRGVFIAAA